MGDTLIPVLHGLRDQVGSELAHPLWPTLAFALGGLVAMLTYSPLADRIASRLITKPPTLGVFRAIQQSRAKLIVGIVIAWLLGGVLEETVFRGIILRLVELYLRLWFTTPVASLAAIFIAAAGATLFHFYQGARAMLIIAQLSILFGVLFVVSGYNLMAVILCHGLYDTIAFIRFANKKSRYSDFDQAAPG